MDGKKTSVKRGGLQNKQLGERQEMCVERGITWLQVKKKVDVKGECL